MRAILTRGLWVLKRVRDRLATPRISTVEMEARMLTHLRVHGRTCHRDLNRLFTRGRGRSAPGAPVHHTGVILNSLAQEGYVTSDSEPCPGDTLNQVYWSPTGRRAPLQSPAHNAPIPASGVTA